MQAGAAAEAAEAEVAARPEELAAQPLVEAGEPAQASVEGAKPAKKHKKRKREEPTQEEASPGGIRVGVNGGGWGPSGTPGNGAGGQIRAPRIGQREGIRQLSRASGIHVDWDDCRSVRGDGVSSLNDAEYASHLVSVIAADPSVVSIEILNEPEGNWFWGEGANSKANAEAYARLLEAVYNKVEATFGSEHPLLLGAFRRRLELGGCVVERAQAEGTRSTAWSCIRTAARGSRAQSASGNRGQVERAHSYTGKPVYVTEVGWPTATKFPPTSDSLQWTQPEQAANIYSFVNWARSTGYVAGVFIYELPRRRNQRPGASTGW